MILKHRRGRTAPAHPCGGRLYFAEAGHKGQKRENQPCSGASPSPSALSLPDHILRLHLHCPFRYPFLPYPQLVTRCLPSVLLPIFCVLVVLALPVSFKKKKKSKITLMIWQVLEPCSCYYSVCLVYQNHENSRQYISFSLILQNFLLHPQSQTAQEAGLAKKRKLQTGRYPTSRWEFLAGVDLLQWPLLQFQNFQVCEDLGLLLQGRLEITWKQG